jgi:hypothetical protein
MFDAATNSNEIFREYDQMMVTKDPRIRGFALSQSTKAAVLRELNICGQMKPHG